MIIDVFTHFLPPGYVDALLDMPDIEPGHRAMVERFRSIKALVDIEARLDMMRRWPEVKQVISLAIPTPEMVPDRHAERIAVIGNNGLAELCRAVPDRFPAFIASLPMNDIPAALREFDRAVTELGARGVQLLTSIRGRPLDEPAFLPIFEQAAAYDLPIFLHPYRPQTISDYPQESGSQYEIYTVLGWPQETSIAMARLVFSGIFQRLPDIKILTHHLGGILPYLAGRVGPMWEQFGLRSGNADYAAIRARMTASPIEYFRRFYADTAIGGDVASLRCGLDFFGVDKVLFASDFPFGPDGGAYFAERNFDAFVALALPSREAEKIASANAVRLLKL